MQACAAALQALAYGVVGKACVSSLLCSTGMVGKHDVCMCVLLGHLSCCAAVPACTFSLNLSFTSVSGPSLYSSLHCALEVPESLCVCVDWGPEQSCI